MASKPPPGWADDEEEVKPKAASSPKGQPKSEMDELADVLKRCCFVESSDTDPVGLIVQFHQAIGLVNDSTIMPKADGSERSFRAEKGNRVFNISIIPYRGRIYVVGCVGDEKSGPFPKYADSWRFQRGVSGAKEPIAAMNFFGTITQDRKSYGHFNESPKHIGYSTGYMIYPWQRHGR